MNKPRWALLGILFLVLAAWAAAATPNAGDMGGFRAQYVATEKALIEKMSQKSLWEDSQRKAELADCLGLVAVMRSPRFIPVLLQHIDYRAMYGSADPARIHSPEELFPAAAALRRVGMPAVQPVLDEMKTLNPAPARPADPFKAMEESEQFERQTRRSSVLIYCLGDIYADGGFGVPMARLRVQLEAEKVSGKEREFLLKALDHVAFRLEKK